MNKGKQKAFLYQITNVIFMIAFAFTLFGLIQDMMKPSSWAHLNFIFYYAVTMIILVLAMFYNQANLQNIFYRNMDAFTARTAYECILHVTKGYYTVYIHCLLFLGDFAAAKACLKAWKPSIMQLTFQHYFQGLIAYQDQDAQGLQEAIDALSLEHQPVLEDKGVLDRMPVGKQAQKTSKKAFDRCQQAFINQLNIKQALLTKDYANAIERMPEAEKTCLNQVEKLALLYDKGLAYEGIGEMTLAKQCFKEVKQGNQHLYFVRLAKQKK